MAKEILALSFLLLTYLGLALGRLPGYPMNRAGVALVGAGFLLLLGVLDLEAAWQDPHTLVFLFGIMVPSAQLGYAGFFALVGQGLWRLARSPLALLFLLSLGAGGLSALFLNDIMALLLTPLVLRLTQGLGLNPVPYLLALMGAVNTGSLLTPTGNPQNIVVASLFGLRHLDFLEAFWPVVLLGLLFQVALLGLLYPEVRSLRPLRSLPPLRLRLHRPLLWKGRGWPWPRGFSWPSSWAIPWPRGPWWPQASSSSPGGSVRNASSTGWTSSSSSCLRGFSWSRKG